MKCRSMVIVGSGIAGIYAALLAKTKFPNAFISLVEQSEQLGGLLSSTSIDGHWFDYGTHVPRFTGDDSIDTLLFSSIDLSAFRQFQNVNAANVGPFNALYTDSPNPFLGSVKNTLRTQQLSELESQNTNDVHDTKDYSSLEAQLTSKYGQSLTTHFFEPLMKKRFGVSTSNLVPDSHKIIGLQRLILGDGELMRDLKKSPSLDEILAFASQEEGVSPLVNIYPKGEKGVRLWIDNLIANLRESGVRIYTKTDICDINKTGSVINSITLSSGDKINCDLLVWTAPLYALIRAAKLKYIPSMRPTFRSSSLFHFVFPDAPLIHSNYVNVYDSEFSSFRVTLYSNLSKTDTDCHRITVEAMHGSDEPAPSCESVCQELYNMGIVSSSSRPTLSHVSVAASGFPVLTPAFKQEMEKQQNFVATKMANVMTLGKASGSAFFMVDVVREAKEKITQYSEKFSETAI
ncbi:NAD(P)-binding protein [Alteromonas sp.]|jgi:protoporphyrinogen oxidase|uniref:NAD(P)-binding protein n=1 Tax=Alteromonas sp. TaxID=232 RepID=UPI003AE485D4